MAAERPPVALRASLEQEIGGLDALDAPIVERARTLGRVWSAA